MFHLLEKLTFLMLNMSNKGEIGWDTSFTPHSTPKLGGLPSLLKKTLNFK